jgi:hypothetical protein
MEKIQKYTVHDGIEGDLFVIVKTDSHMMPFFCPVCEFIMRNHEDFQAHQRFKCCSECEMTFAQSNSKMWDDGWRPTKKDLNSYKDRILSQSLNLFLDDEDN